jgi:small subunit ribosomal protein S7
MPRRRVIEKREILADPVYGSRLLARFINQIMTSGKRSLAEKIVYGALDIIEKRLKRDPLTVLEKALEHIQPMVEVKSRRVGGATYQVPVEIQGSRAMALAMRWLADFARKRGEKGMANKLAGEIMDAADEEGGSSGKGGAVKKREDTHKMAEANKAFSHYRW